MAVNGYKDVVATRTTSGNVGDTLRFEWWQNSQSISGNYTDIGWKLSLIAGGAGKISSSASKSWSVTVDGQNFSGSNTVGIGNNTSKTLASGTKRVYHDSDGSKRLYVSFSQVFNIKFGGKQVGTVSGSSNWDLDTIPRASAFGTVSGDAIGSDISFTINTHSNDFTHTFWYKMPGGEWVTAGKNLQTSFTFRVPISECSKLPNSVSGDLNLCLRTFKGSDQIGSDVFKMIKIYVPEDVVPAVDSVAVTEAVAGIREQFGTYVQDRSKLSVKSVGSGIYGSTIKKYTVLVDGLSYEGEDITTEAIESSGQVPITVVVMDSRGRKANKTVNINVTEYHRPFIRNFDAIRSDPSGVQQNSGTSLKCICDFDISPVGNKNTKRYVIEYRKKSEEQWTQAFNGSVYTFNDSLLEKNVLGVEFPYVVRLTISDFFESITYEDVISSAIVPWCVHPSGKGFAVGGYPDKEAFQVFMNAEFKGAGRFEGTVYSNGLKAALQGWDNNFIAHGNEFNFVPAKYNNPSVHINYRTQDNGLAVSPIKKYEFRAGQGGGYANVIASNFLDDKGYKCVKTNDIVLIAKSKTLPSNAYVSPFSYYDTYNKSDLIGTNKYNIISVCANNDSGAAVPCSFLGGGSSISVVSSRANITIYMVCVVL